MPPNDIAPEHYQKYYANQLEGGLLFQDVVTKALYFRGIVVVGYLVAVGSQAVILPLFGIKIGLGESAEMALWFTAISIVRSYAVRRIFNHITVCNIIRK